MEDERTEAIETIVDLGAKIEDEMDIYGGNFDDLPPTLAAEANKIQLDEEAFVAGTLAKNADGTYPATFAAAIERHKKVLVALQALPPANS